MKPSGQPWESLIKSKGATPTFPQALMSLRENPVFATTRGSQQIKGPSVEAGYVQKQQVSAASQHSKLASQR